MVSLLLHQHQLRCENLQNCAGNEYIPTIDFSTPRGGGRLLGTGAPCDDAGEEWVLLC